MKQSRIHICIAVLLAAFLSACAQKGPILVDFAYQYARAAAEAPSSVIVGVTPFRDDRGKTGSIVGRRFNSLNDEANELVVQGTVTDKVTTALKNAFKDREITVKDVSAWDLTNAGIPDGSQVLIGGEIKTLWVESESSFANTKVKANVELRVVIADTAQKKIIRTLNVASTTERQSIRFSTDFVEAALSEALSMAVNQIFNDEELKNRLK